MTTTERITIDTTVARDLMNHRRSGHPYALELLAMAERGEVELMIAPQGRRLDVTHGDLLDQLQALIDEHVPEARQVARLSEATYPAESLFPGAIVHGFDEAWDEVAVSWEANAPKPRPTGRTASTSRRICSSSATCSSQTTAASSACATGCETSTAWESRR